MKEQFETSLHAFLDEYTSPSELYDPIHYVMKSGGKRVRPMLTLLSCQAVGGTIDNAMHAAIAVELIHNFTLVHDDIMDRSEMRRGRDTVHKKWDESAAILSGDVMIGLATRSLVRSAHHAKQPLAVVDAFSTGIVDVCDGQALDLALMARDVVTMDDYFDMISKKTAKLLEMSVVIGALVGGADTATVENLRQFACGVGIAFQLQDDLLDLLGSEDFGKAQGGDVVEGKRTWLMLRADEIVRTRNAEASDNVTDVVGAAVNLDNASDPGYALLLRAFYENKGLPRERVADVVTMLHALGVVDEARALIARTTHDAFEHLHALPHTEARDMLEALAHNLIARQT